MNVPDGSPLSLDEIQGINLDMTNQDLNQVVTQAEHPMLFSPYFMIHPCRTKDIMKLHVAKKGNYLITWLSTLNTLANFGLDSRLFTEDG